MRFMPAAAQIQTKRDLYVFIHILLFAAHFGYAFEKFLKYGHIQAVGDSLFFFFKSDKSRFAQYFQEMVAAVVLNSAAISPAVISCFLSIVSIRLRVPSAIAAHMSFIGKPSVS